MESETEKELEAVQKKIFITNLISVPGPIALGLGIAAMSGTKVQAWHPWFNDPGFVTGLLALGIVLTIWSHVKSAPLFKRKKELMNLRKG